MAEKPLSISQSLLAKSIEEVAEEIADHQDTIAQLQARRDDLIRDLLRSGVSQSRAGRIADLSREQIRNIATFRYSRESRRKKKRNPGPPRD